MPSFTIGLTGGVASGKSLVSEHFRKLGVPVLDADQVSRAVVAPGQPALLEIEQEFGSAALQADGHLNRMYMRKQVFADAEARKRLERITHPHIRHHIKNWRSAQTAIYCILENAILIESGMDKMVDRVLVVDVAEDEQRRRLIQRDGIDLELAGRMLAAQASRSTRLQRADDVIENNASPELAATAVAGLHEKYLELAENAARLRSQK